MRACTGVPRPHEGKESPRSFPKEGTAHVSRGAAQWCLENGKKLEEIRGKEGQGPGQEKNLQRWAGAKSQKILGANLRSWKSTLKGMGRRRNRTMAGKVNGRREGSDEKSDEKESGLWRSPGLDGCGGRHKPMVSAFLWAGAALAEWGPGMKGLIWGWNSIGRLQGKNTGTGEMGVNNGA